MMQDIKQRTGEAIPVSILPFRRVEAEQRKPRLSDLTSAQIEQLLRLLSMTDDLAKLLGTMDRIATGCPVARNVLGQ